MPCRWHLLPAPLYYYPICHPKLRQVSLRCRLDPWILPLSFGLFYHARFTSFSLTTPCVAPGCSHLLTRPSWRERGSKDGEGSKGSSEKERKQQERSMKNGKGRRIRVGRWGSSGRVSRLPHRGKRWQQTTDNEQQTTNSKEQTTKNKQQRTKNTQRTGRNTQQTTNSRQQTFGFGPPIHLGDPVGCSGKLADSRQASTYTFPRVSPNGPAAPRVLASLLEFNRRA